MVAPRRMVRIALELEEKEAEEMQALLDEFNAFFSPLKLSRSDLIRGAIRDRVMRMQAQIEQLKKQGTERK